MTLEALIYYGDANAAMPEDALGWLVEIRVEQELNKITRFALRFEDDLCGDGPAMAGRPEIAPNTMITVVAGAGNIAPVCLARGPITRIRSATQIGGAGSWVEAHCETRQIEMDRATLQAKWVGAHKGVVEAVLGTYGFTADVQNVDGEAGEDDNQLNQAGTDFAFLNKMASEHGVDFWLDYTAETGPHQASVTETAHFRISPPVPDGAAFDIASFSLSPDTPGPVFRINAVGDDCPTVNSFEAEADMERPTSASAATQDTNSGEEAETKATAAPDTAEPGPTIAEFGDVRREITITAPGNSAELELRQQAALRAASWFAESKATTSAGLLHHIVVPHDIVHVQGAGPQLSIPWQVKAVTHVINGVAHMMDIKLRSNFLGEVA